jgi:hypothetical protein
MKQSKRKLGRTKDVLKTFSLATVAIFMVSSAVSVSFGDLSVNPAVVEPGETVNNQQFSFEVRNVSADGDTDIFYVAFPNELNGSISANQASFETAAVSSSVQLVDGTDADGVDDTFKFETSPSNAQNYTDLNATLDVSVDYPDVSERYRIEATVEDSNGESTSNGAVTVEARPRNLGQETQPDDSSVSERESENEVQETDSRQEDSQDSESEGLFALIGSFFMNLF